ncbi:hypothetical protein [uncultured Ruegeria sp.]|uniref:hypothetical protein n=1 Tax=uncultured Ruegeria sp. TaxID=259304 RepID=UPI0026204934|nr:hypothetical protein [uncultured Ruegeria sp.]
MKYVFTQAALQRCSISELRALFASVQHDLVRSDAGSSERSQALSSLDAISRVIARKISTGFQP